MFKLEVSFNPNSLSKELIQTIGYFKFNLRSKFANVHSRLANVCSSVANVHSQALNEGQFNILGKEG